MFNSETLIFALNLLDDDISCLGSELHAIRECSNLKVWDVLFKYVGHLVSSGADFKELVPDVAFLYLFCEVLDFESTGTSVRPSIARWRVIFFSMRWHVRDLESESQGVGSPTYLMNHRIHSIKSGFWWISSTWGWKGIQESKGLGLIGNCLNFGQIISLRRMISVGYKTKFNASLSLAIIECLSILNDLLDCDLCIGNVGRHWASGVEHENKVYDIWVFLVVWYYLLAHRVLCNIKCHICKVRWCKGFQATQEMTIDEYLYSEDDRNGNLDVDLVSHGIVSIDVCVTIGNGVIVVAFHNDNSSCHW